MSAPSTSGLSVELLLRVIDIKYGYITLLFTLQNYLEHHNEKSVGQLPHLHFQFLDALML